MRIFSPEETQNSLNIMDQNCWWVFVYDLVSYTDFVTDSEVYTHSKYCIIYVSFKDSVHSVF